MEFQGNNLTNFIFEKILSRIAQVTGRLTAVVLKLGAIATLGAFLRGKAATKQRGR